MVSETIPEIHNLSRSEKWLLMSELWQSLAGADDDPDTPDTHKAILDECLDEIERHPGAGSPSSEVKQRILNS